MKPATERDSARAPDANLTTEKLMTGHIAAQPTDLHSLEHWRTRLEERLTRVCREPDPFVVEGVLFTSWRDASKRRGEVTEMILARIDTINARICDIIAPGCERRAPRRLAGLVMASVGVAV